MDKNKELIDFEEDVCCAEGADDKKTFTELRENSKSIKQIEEEKDSNTKSTMSKKTRHLLKSSNKCTEKSRNLTSPKCEA
jgi:hypothetical protein